MKAVDFAGVEWIVLWGQRQGVTFLEKKYKQLHEAQTPSEEIL